MLIKLLIISIVFIIYQLLIFIQLSNDLKARVKSNRLRGVHELQEGMYVPNENGKFVCIYSVETIDFKKVNDDYCDCLDGTDEPATNACAEGEFSCTNQISFQDYPKRLPSNRVNDGVCDCCDGSDEWKSRLPIGALSRQIQITIQRFHPPCPQFC